MGYPENNNKPGIATDDIATLASIVGITKPTSHCRIMLNV